MSFKVKDQPGVMPVSEMKDLFERVVMETPVFASNTPLGIMEINGQFSHYMHPDTDTMWLGFALGMRCAERINKGRAAQ